MTGIVVNDRPGVPRDERDRLRAALHQAARAPEQADRAHLRGRVSWVAEVNPAQGARLRALYDAIVWPAA